MGIKNPDAWPIEMAVQASIGPAHPSHPYHRVYYDGNGDILSNRVIAANTRKAQKADEFPHFPVLKRIVSLPSSETAPDIAEDQV